MPISGSSPIITAVAVGRNSCPDATSAVQVSRQLIAVETPPGQSQVYGVDPEGRQSAVAEKQVLQQQRHEKSGKHAAAEQQSGEPAEHEVNGAYPQLYVHETGHEQRGGHERDSRDRFLPGQAR